MKAICSLLLSVATLQEALHLVQAGVTKSDYTVTPSEYRNGWVNPEDLDPMPQCVAQQDQTTWLSAMTRCTSKRCTRHFGVVCTHHQWLTELSCLSTEFSPDLISHYVRFCSRSVLAKAQLFDWVHKTTGRTWLVEVGDSYELQSLSPRALTKGYAAIRVTEKAPRCLTQAGTHNAIEPFGEVIDSCEFTADTAHTGNAARPWEYREALHSLVSLDSLTAGYDRTGSRIAYGNYFDKQCFCDTFGIHEEAQICPGPSLASTKERLWLNATCGPEYLPTNWTDQLRTTEFDYIALKHWNWPKSKESRLEKAVKIAEQCATDACDFDSSGYCKVERAVDRACICRSISYDDCEGPCRFFEARVDFVNWLHDLCGRVEGWHGLPEHWRQLAAPIRADMIPWRCISKLWGTPGHLKGVWPDTWSAWQLGSIGLVNLVAFIAGVYVRTTQGTAHARALAWMTPQSWVLSGLAIAAIHLIVNWMNATHVQATAGYENVPISQLTLLWCSMPRSTWLVIFLTIVYPSQDPKLHTIASLLASEAILQILSALPMIQTVDYGLQHDFYWGGLKRLNQVPAAQYMYAGAAMWVSIAIVSAIFLLQCACDTAQSRSRKGRRASPHSVQDTITSFNEQWTWFEDAVARRWRYEPCDSENEPLMSGGAQDYGTLPTKGVRLTSRIRRRTVRIVIVAIVGGALLWVAQWLFWVGFIGLVREE